MDDTDTAEDRGPLAFPLLPFTPDRVEDPEVTLDRTGFLRQAGEQGTCSTRFSGGNVPHPPPPPPGKAARARVRPQAEATA